MRDTAALRGDDQLMIDDGKRNAYDNMRQFRREGSGQPHDYCRYPAETFAEELDYQTSKDQKKVSDG